MRQEAELKEEEEEEEEEKSWRGCFKKESDVHK